MYGREDPEAGPTVAGLSKVKVDSVDTIFALLQVRQVLVTHACICRRDTSLLQCM